MSVLLCCVLATAAMAATMGVYAALGQFEHAKYIAGFFFVIILFAVIVLPVMLLVFWPFIFYLIALSRVSRRQSLGILIRNCLESNLPLPLAIRTYAATCFSPLYRGEVQRFAAALESGTSLIDAANRFHKLLPAETVRLIQLQASPDDAVRLMTEAFTFENERSFIYTYSMARLTYILVLLWLFLFACIRIGPYFYEIVADYDTDMPLISALFFMFSQDTGHWKFAFAFLFTIAALGVLLLKLGYFSCRPIFLRRFFWDSDCAAWLRYLSAAVARNVSFSNATSIYLKTLGSCFLRRKFQKLNAAIDSGTRWTDALAKARIVTLPEAKLLNTAERTGNTAVVLAQLAQAKESRQNRLDDLGSKLAFVICILLFGVMIAVYALSLFVPICNIIYHLC